MTMYMYMDMDMDNDTDKDINTTKPHEYATTVFVLYSDSYHK